MQYGKNKQRDKLSTTDTTLNINSYKEEPTKTLYKNDKYYRKEITDDSNAGLNDSKLTKSIDILNTTNNTSVDYNKKNLKDMRFKS